MIDMGICGPNVLMVHCVHLTDEDIEKAGKYDLKISHNVCSNMYLSSGAAPIPKLLKAGVTCSLGVDGAASNNANDMIELMKNTALMQKCATRDPLSMSAEKVVEMATIDGARAIGMEDEIGSIEAGKKADMVIFDPYECVKAVPLHNPCSTLVYSASLKNITDVYVDGRGVMEKGVILTVVLTPQGLKEGWGVRIEEGRIACVGPWDSLGGGSNEEAQTVCLPGQMLLPGCVNGHNHMYGVLSHGITAEAMVTDFSDYLKDFWWPCVEDRVDHDLARITARWACVEMIDSLSLIHI